MINKQQYEAQLRQIFKMLLENKTQDKIARELNLGVRTVSRYTQRIEQRYGEIQRKKTNNTLFLEAQLFKNRMLYLYNILEKKAQDPKVNGNECAKCCEVASNIAIDILKIESESIHKVVKDALIAEKEARERRSLSPSAIRDRMMMEELEESC